MVTIEYQVTDSDNLYGIFSKNWCGDHFAPVFIWALVSLPWPSGRRPIKQKQAMAIFPLFHHLNSPLHPRAHFLPLGLPIAAYMAFSGCSERRPNQALFILHIQDCTGIWLGPLLSCCVPPGYVTVQLASLAEGGDTQICQFCNLLASL